MLFTLIKERMMKILIACEFSGIVREAFAKKGHDVISCDLLPTEIPGNHYQGDVFNIIDDGFDMMIAFPPCTYLSHAGNGALKNNPERQKLQLHAFDFFMTLWNAPISKICIENPRGHVTRLFKRETQVIEPYYFGEPERKRTCLWLKNLPPLINFFINPKGIFPKKTIKRKTGQRKGGNYGYYYIQGKSAKDKSKTFPGIANAMADQWG